MTSVQSGFVMFLFVEMSCFAMVFFWTSRFAEYEVCILVVTKLLIVSLCGMQVDPLLGEAKA